MYMYRRIYADTNFLLCVIKLHNQHKFHKCYLPFDMFVSDLNLVFPLKKNSEYYSLFHSCFFSSIESLSTLRFATFVCFIPF